MSDSPIAEDDKLRDFVLENLRQREIYQRFKVELSKEIREILNSNSPDDDALKIYKKYKHERLQKLLNTDEGLLCLYLIKDTLKDLGLVDTSLILDKEMDEFSNLYQNKSQTDIQKLIDSIKLNLMISNNSTNHHSNPSSNNMEENIKNDLSNNQSASASASTSQSLHPLTSVHDRNNFNDDLEFHQDEKVPIMLQIFKELIKQESLVATKENTNSISNETYTKSSSKINDSIS